MSDYLRFYVEVEIALDVEIVASQFENLSLFCLNNSDVYVLSVYSILTVYLTAYNYTITE